MNTLKGELIINSVVSKEVEMSFEDRQGFFVALVNVCDQISVDVPIWTSLEERILERNGEVLITIDEDTVLRISTIS